MLGDLVAIYDANSGIIYRYFKRRVYETNYSNIEKVLLMKLNFQETIRMILRNAFLVTDPDLTAEIIALYQQCPHLFSRTLNRADRNELDFLLEDGDFELDIAQSANETHLEPSVINRIPTAEVAGVEHPANDGRLPLRAGDMVSRFRGLIRSAYARDYAKPQDYPTVFGNKPIQWCRKLAFVE
jgi:hypothetical protein